MIWKGQEAQIAFSRRVEFFRGLSLLLEAWEQGKRALECVEQPAFRFNGYMMDCSRNAVPTVETVKEMVRMMALMGLGVKCGDRVCVRAEGGDEAAACEGLRAFFEENF